MFERRERWIDARMRFGGWRNGLFAICLQAGEKVILIAMSVASDSFGEDLVLARAGDRDALDRLLRRLERRFLNDASRQLDTGLKGRTRASDLLQDAYLDVVAHIGDFEGGTENEFYAWVATIIHRSARQQHRFLTAQKRKPPSRTSEFNSLARDYVRSSTSPASQLQSIESVELVHRALQALREDYRVVIEKVVFEHRPVVEVAELLGRTEPATRMLLSRARAALTLKIEELESE